jgi:hypothetical protein
LKLLNLVKKNNSSEKISVFLFSIYFQNLYHLIENNCNLNVDFIKNEKIIETKIIYFLEIINSKNIVNHIIEPNIYIIDGYDSNKFDEIVISINKSINRVNNFYQYNLKLLLHYDHPSINFNIEKGEYLTRLKNINMNNNDNDNNMPNLNIEIPENIINYKDSLKSLINNENMELKDQEETIIKEYGEKVLTALQIASNLKT